MRTAFLRRLKGSLAGAFRSFGPWTVQAARRSTAARPGVREAEDFLAQSTGTRGRSWDQTAVESAGLRSAPRVLGGSGPAIELEELRVEEPLLVTSRPAQVGDLVGRPAETLWLPSHRGSLFARRCRRFSRCSGSSRT